MEDYELFRSCNMLGVEDGKEENEFPKEYREVEGEAQIDETPSHKFTEDKPIKYIEPKIKIMYLWDEANPKKIFVGDNWNPPEGNSIQNIHGI